MMSPHHYLNRNQSGYCPPLQFHFITSLLQLSRSNRNFHEPNFYLQYWWEKPYKSLCSGNNGRWLNHVGYQGPALDPSFGVLEKLGGDLK